MHNWSQTASSYGCRSPAGWSTPVPEGSNTASLFSPVLPPLTRAGQHRGVSCGLGHALTSRCFPMSGTSSSTVPPWLQSSLQGFPSSPFPALSPALGAGSDTHKTRGEQITPISWILQSYVIALQWFNGKWKSEVSSLGVNFNICLTIKLLKNSL